MTLKPAAKFTLLLLFLGAIFYVVKFTSVGSMIMPKGKNNQAAKVSDSVKDLAESGVKTIKVGVVTWGGYAGGQYFNKGFVANEESRFYKDYGFFVQFVVLDDFEASRNAWKAGEVDLLWTTVDSYCTETQALAEFKPKLLFQADWFRGGDAIVAKSSVSKINDLKGKKVAVAYGTPSHTFLLATLEAAGIDQGDINIVQVKSAVDAANTYKAGAADAAIVWSPDDEDCVKSVAGTKVLKSTKDATNVIADGFFVKEEYLNQNKEELKKFITGWMIGANEVSTNLTAKQEAVQILSQNLNISPEVAEKSLNNVRLANLGDNKNFFGLNTSFKGITAEYLYNKMIKKYTAINFISGAVPSWRNVSHAGLLSSIDLPGQEAEGAVKFKEITDVEKNVEADATKNVAITFPSGSSILTEEAMDILRVEVGDVTRTFSGYKMRVEGNTDNVGNPGKNLELSRKRAQAVARFLTNEYGFDRNKFIVIGNGSNNPVEDNGSAEGRAANRRTDFMLIGQ